LQSYDSWPTLCERCAVELLGPYWRSTIASTEETPQRLARRRRRQAAKARKRHAAETWHAPDAIATW